MAKNNKSLQDQLDDISKRLDDMIAQRGLGGEPAPKPAAPAPAKAPAAAPAAPTQTPAAVAPSAPAAGAQPVAENMYYVTYEVVDSAALRSGADANTGYIPNMPMSFAYEKLGDTQANWEAENPGVARSATTLEEIIAGNRTSTLRSEKEIQNAKAQNREYVKGRIYRVGNDPKTGRPVFVKVKSISRFNPKELTLEQWAKISQTERWSVKHLVAKYGGDAAKAQLETGDPYVDAAQTATSPVSPQGGLPVPPQGETPVSVAPRAISGESAGPVQGYNIVSSSRNKGRGYSPEVLADMAKITNATWGKFPLTKEEVAAAIGRDPNPPKGYQGKPYEDIESWYQGNKTGDRAADDKMLQDLVAAKFKKYPEIIETIDRYGGIEFLEASTHEGTGHPDWEGKGSKSKTIRMWIDAYNAVRGAAPAPEKMTTAATPEQQVRRTSIGEAPDEALMRQSANMYSGEPQAENVVEDAPRAPLPDGPKVAIIGTSGSKGNIARLTAEDFQAMYDDAAARVTPDTVVVSGGAAWADHVAVRLYLDGKVAGLVLHLPYPAEIDVKGMTKSEGVARYYHKLFSEKVYGDPEKSFDEIDLAIEKGAIVTYGDGAMPASFFGRNKLIASDAVDGMITYTFDTDSDGPGDGGAKHTWEKSDLDPERKTSIDIRELRADSDEARRVAIYETNKARARGKREGDPLENARRRASAQESGGSTDTMTVTEINESRRRKYRVLDGLPKTIDAEVSGIGGEFGAKDGIVLRSVTLPDALDGIGERKEQISKGAKHLVEVLVAAGVPESALRDGFASPDEARTKPFFSSKKGLTPIEADAKNREKAKRVLKKVIADLESLRDSGKLKAITHPDVAEGMDYLLRQLLAYRRDMASGDFENVRWKPQGKSVYSRSTQRVLPEHLATLLPWMGAVMEENGVEERTRILDQIEREVLDSDTVELAEGTEVTPYDKPWIYKSKVTGQVINIGDVLGYANGTIAGYRPYALDEAGIVPQEWIDVDENGLGIELPSIKSPLPGSQTKAHIKFQLAVDESVIPDVKLQWGARKAFEDFSAHKLGMSFGKMEMMPYTRDAYAVMQMGRAYSKRVSGSLGTMKLYRFPDSFHLINETGSVEAGGRTVYLPTSPGDAPVMVIVNQGDPMDEELSKIVDQAKKAAARRAEMYKPTRLNPTYVNMEVPEEIFVSRPFDVSDGMRLDPLVQQAVRHTVPITLPEGHLFGRGLWAPARAAAAYVKRLSAIKAGNPEQAQLIDEMIGYLTKGVLVNEDYDPGKVVEVLVDPVEASSNGEPVLILPDENGNYPEKSEMVDGIKMSDPDGWTESTEMISDRESLMGSKMVEEDRGYRAMRQIEQAQESGERGAIPEQTIKEAELFETSIQGRSIRDTMPERLLVNVDPLTEELGFVGKEKALDLLKSVRPSQYNPDLAYSTLFSGFQRELGARDIGARVSVAGYSEPVTPVSASVRPFMRSSVKPLAPDNVAATRRIMSGLVYLLRYHAQRAKYWNFQGEGYRDTAIISDLADDFSRLFGIAYEPNLRAAALMSGFVRRVEEIAGDEAFAETVWDEFVLDLARQDRINSDASWLGPDMFLDTRLIAKNQGALDAINLYREYVSSQIAGVQFGQEGNRRPDTSLNKAFDSVVEGGWSEGNWQEEEPEVRYRAYPEDPSTLNLPQKEGELVGPEWFGEIQFPQPRLPGVPYESKSSYVVESEILKIQSELANISSEMKANTARLAAARGEVKNLDPNDPRYNEKKYALDIEISRLEKAIARYEPRRSAFTSRLAVLRKEKASGKSVVDTEFTVGRAYDETAAPRGLSGAIQRLVESSKGPDGVVNKQRLLNNILLSWDLISTHHATDANSPIRKLGVAKNQAGFQMALVKLIENSQAVEIPMKWGDENTVVVDQETGLQRYPYLEMLRQLELGSREGSRTVSITPGKLREVLSISNIVGKEQLEWLVALAENNPVELRWDKKTKSIWIHPIPAAADKTQQSIMLKGMYGPKADRKEVRLSYDVSDADAERLVSDLGLSEMVRVERVYGPDPGRPILGGSQYKLVLAGSPVNPSSLVAKNDAQSDGESLFRIGVDYQLRANFLGAIVEAAKKLGVDLTPEIQEMIKPVEMTKENIEKIVQDSEGRPIGPMEKEAELRGAPYRHSVEFAREIYSYPMPVRQAMYSMMRARLEDPTLDESTRQLADMIISTERTARTISPSFEETLANQRKGWVSKQKVIGYGAGGAIAGVLAGYLGTRAVAGEEEAARQMPLNVGFEAIGALPKVGGPVASVAALGLTAATGGDIWRTMFNIAGGFAGGAIGGTAGLVGGPVGSIAGSVAGGTAGSFAADALYTSIFGNNTPSQPTVPTNVAFDEPQKVKIPGVGQESELQNQIKILGG